MVTIKNASYAYRKGKMVLENINLHLKAGCIYGLLGENGVGKTTLLKSLAGLVFPKDGEIDVLGFRPGKRQPDFLKEIFMIPEDFSLPPVKIQRYVQTLAPFYPEFNYQQFDALLGEFSVPIDAGLDKISFGQRKKVLIAFGLASNTRILLMDEPTNGLDIPSKSQFRKVIASELSEDRCFIISTHQVRDLDNLIDQLVVLSKQQVLLSASLDEISNTFSFKLLKSLREDALYVEQDLSGYHAILPNIGHEDTKVDIELFFKATLLEGKKIKEMLYKTIADEEYI